MDLMAMIQAVPGVGPYLQYVLVVFGICAVVAAQLPPPSNAGSLYGVAYKLINLLGHNYNQARNAVADSAKATTTPTAVVALLVVLSLQLGLGV